MQRTKSSYRKSRRPDNLALQGRLLCRKKSTMLSYMSLHRTIHIFTKKTPLKRRDVPKVHRRNTGHRLTVCGYRRTATRRPFATRGPRPMIRPPPLILLLIGRTRRKFMKRLTTRQSTIRPLIPLKRCMQREATRRPITTQRPQVPTFSLTICRRRWYALIGTSPFPRKKLAWGRHLLFRSRKNTT